MKWCKCLSCPKSEVEDVVTLDFSCSSLKEVPSLVFNFERTLENLYLDYNKIAELPRTLFQCEELRYLGLSDNEIETIPPLIEKLSHLENLLLSRNCLALESIPPNIHKCQKLKTLHLSSNSLTKVPGCITRLVSLKELYLNNCDLEFLPANFGRLHNLRILELRENHLTTLPKSLKRLSDLRRLDISSNMFKKFPDVIGTMTNLTELWLNDNFIGEIPDCVGTLHKLTHFDVSCNRLEKLTHSIGFCNSMTLLLLSMNDLKELPSTIGNLVLLHTLKADHNLLESLPVNIGKLSNLEELDVQFNNLKAFPSSIGMLRKLSSLVAAQNSLTSLPTEIGSCISLSVLSLHYNILMYLPEEIGHLQRLTSISLINNKLQYLPITILSLQKLKALWLSHNQSQPLITLQKEALQNGLTVLTCVFLPQIEVPLHIPQTSEVVVPSGRKIGFLEPNLCNDLPAKLNRIPTPHPKAFVKYQRTLENTLRRNQENVENINVDPVYVKEANIVPMKNSTDLGEDYYPGLCEKPDLTQSLNDDSEYVASLGSGCTSISLENSIGNAQLDDSKSTNEKDYDVFPIAKPAKPPPYHIAAAYSKDAHLFLNTAREPELKPKYFTQDQPSNILNPQPKHAKTELDSVEDVIIKLLWLVSKFLQVDLRDPTYQALIDKYLKFCNVNETTNLRLQVLRATDNLLSSQDLIYAHKKYLVQFLDHLQNSIDHYGVKCCDLPELNHNEAYVINLTAKLITSVPDDKFWNLFEQILQVESNLPENYRLENYESSNTHVDAKMRLIKVAIYFMEIPNNSEDYRANFERLAKLQNKLMNGLEFNGIVRTGNINVTLESSAKRTNWLFGAHKNTKIMKVELTPCCYVLGFSVNHNAQGVFVNEVDKNGNAYQKLFTGDKVLMLDERDISKMDPEEALKAVQMWGPETETFLISRN